MNDAGMPAAPRGAYVRRGGKQTYLQPLALSGVRFYAFVLDADATALQRLCDTQLNEPSGHAVEYVPLMSKVLLGFADIARADSVPQPDHDMGWMTEVDVAFWVPVARIKREGPTVAVESISWMLPYVFVDNAWALTSGREIYGFAKELGGFVLPRRDEQPASFQVSTMLIPKFGADSQVQNTKLLEVRRTDAVSLGTLETIWHDTRTAFEATFKLLHAEEHQVTLPGSGLLVELYDFLVHHEVPLTFLKQIREASDGTMSCYQSIVEAPAQVTTFRGGGELPGQYALSILPCDSHPIAADLGLSGNDIPVASAWFADFDFVMQAGRELWKA